MSWAQPHLEPLGPACHKAGSASHPGTAHHDCDAHPELCPSALALGCPACCSRCGTRIAQGDAAEAGSRMAPSATQKIYPELDLY